MTPRARADRGRGAARAAGFCLVALAAVAAPRAGGDSGGPPTPVPRSAQDAPSAAPPSPRGSDPSARDAAARAALERGLDWLAAEQERGVDGSWPHESASLRAPVGVTSLATLALLAGGSGIERGPHGAAVARAVDYLIGRVERDPRARTIGFVSSPGDEASQMHGHGYATHALAEAYSVSPSTTRGRELARILPLAVQLIERSQGPEGAWMYKPWITVQHEGSVTITLVQALRAAQGAGLVVDASVVAAAEDYVRRSQVEDGSFAYHLGSDRTSVGLTAAAIATLNATGTYDDPAIRRGIDAIWRDLGKRGNARAGIEFPFYERLYVAQALWQLTDRTHFDRWYDDEVRYLLSEQRPEGRWTDSRYGDAYATAMNCLVLALPDGLLPSFAR